MSGARGCFNCGGCAWCFRVVHLFFHYTSLSSVGCHSNGTTLLSFLGFEFEERAVLTGLSNVLSFHIQYLMGPSYYADYHLRHTKHELSALIVVVIRMCAVLT